LKRTTLLLEWCVCRFAGKGVIPLFQYGQPYNSVPCDDFLARGCAFRPLIPPFSLDAYNPLLLVQGDKSWGGKVRVFWVNPGALKHAVGQGAARVGGGLYPAVGGWGEGAWETHFGKGGGVGFNIL